MRADLQGLEFTSPIVICVLPVFLDPKKKTVSSQGSAVVCVWPASFLSSLLWSADWICVIAEQVQWKDLEIQKQIGEGSFGKVFLAKWRETTVAVKQLTYTGVSGSLEDNDEFIQQGMNVLLQGLEQVTCSGLFLAWLKCELHSLHCGSTVFCTCSKEALCSQGSWKESPRNQTCRNMASVTMW